MQRFKTLILHSALLKIIINDFGRGKGWHQPNFSIWQPFNDRLRSRSNLENKEIGALHIQI